MKKDERLLDPMRLSPDIRAGIFVRETGKLARVLDPKGASAIVQLAQTQVALHTPHAVEHHGDLLLKSAILFTQGLDMGDKTRETMVAVIKGAQILFIPPKQNSEISEDSA